MQYTTHFFVFILFFVFPQWKCKLCEIGVFVSVVYYSIPALRTVPNAGYKPNKYLLDDKE